MARERRLQTTLAFVLSLIASSGLLGSQAHGTDCGPRPYDQLMCFCQVPREIPGIAFGHVVSRGDFESYFVVDESRASIGLTPLYSIGDEVRVYDCGGSSEARFLLLNFGTDKANYHACVLVPPADATITALPGSDPKCQTQVPFQDVVNAYEAGDCARLRKVIPPPKDSCGDSGGCVASDAPRDAKWSDLSAALIAISGLLAIRVFRRARTH